MERLMKTTHVHEVSNDLLNPLVTCIIRGKYWSAVKENGAYLALSGYAAYGVKDSTPWSVGADGRSGADRESIINDLVKNDLVQFSGEPPNENQEDEQTIAYRVSWKWPAQLMDEMAAWLIKNYTEKPAKGK